MTPSHYVFVIYDIINFQISSLSLCLTQCVWLDGFNKLVFPWEEVTLGLFSYHSTSTYKLVPNKFLYYLLYLLPNFYNILEVKLYMSHLFINIFLALLF